MNDVLMVLGALALPIAVFWTSLLPVATLRWSQREIERWYDKYTFIERD